METHFLITDKENVSDLQHPEGHPVQQHARRCRTVGVRRGLFILWQVKVIITNKAQDNLASPLLATSPSHTRALSQYSLYSMFWRPMYWACWLCLHPNLIKIGTCQCLSLKGTTTNTASSWHLTRGDTQPHIHTHPTAYTPPNCTHTSRIMLHNEPAAAG